MSGAARSTEDAIRAADAAAEALRGYRLLLEQKPLPCNAPPPLPEPVSSLRSVLPDGADQGSTERASARSALHPRRTAAAVAASRGGRSQQRSTPEASAGTVMALPQPDWLYHHLSISGPAAELMALRIAARGPGILPWPCDHAALEEDLFVLLMRDRQRGGPSLGTASAHTLAGRLRQLVQRRDAQAQAHDVPPVPFDLQAVLPVPPDLLLAGPNETGVRSWLWRYWGTTRPLRQVREADVVPPSGANAEAEPVWQLRFWSADWSPWPAMVALARRWPALRFQLRPVYERV